jgi:chorismate synthase
MRFLTAGESHGPGLTVMIDDFPAGVPIDSAFLNADLARRQIGYGRGGRMRIETDTAKINAGVRFELSTGAPIALWIENRDFANWLEVMAADGEAGDAAEAKKFVRPRPGHADLAGYYKYGLTDLRDVLERASARETAARVAAGAVAKMLLHAVGIQVFSHVLSIGGKRVSDLPADYATIQARAESNDLRCAGDDALLTSIRDHIIATNKAGSTLGGEVEVVALNVPPGLGTYVQWDRKLDGQLAQAVMSIQAVKAVSLGEGLLGGDVTGSEFHDAICKVSDTHVTRPTITRPTNRAGGLEGGVTNGMPILVRAVMKPISTMRTPLESINLETGDSEQGHFERSDVTAVPACGVVAEAMVAIVLARALMDKFGHDSLADIRRNLSAYLATCTPITQA